MSTEAPRAPVPPRLPPRPATPPTRSASPPTRPTSPPKGPPPEAPAETTTRLRPVPPQPMTAPAAAPRTSVPLPPEMPPRPAAPPLPPGAPPQPRRRPVGAVDHTPRPGAGPPTMYGQPRPYAAEHPAEMTTRLRPVSAHHPVRTVAAAVCMVLGLGLIGGAAAGSWLTGESSAEPTARTAYTAARGLWHSTPVDTLFPRTLKGTAAGPGGADRTWTRLAVAPDSSCAGGFDPLLLKVLQPVGCVRMLRATYTDATHTSVTTVGMVFTEADPAAMTALRTRFTGEEGLAQRTDLVPRTFPVKGTDAASFGDKQRASWTLNVLTDAPVVVYAVSGFADGRAVAGPQSAALAVKDGATTPAAQAGLGHDAKGIEERVERGLRAEATRTTEASR
jgi:hypothetical protein